MVLSTIKKKKLSLHLSDFRNNLWFAIGKKQREITNLSQKFKMLGLYKLIKKNSALSRSLIYWLKP